jgi:tRNA threonylcarbamoyladenosine biosynthesis protein TsaE
MNTVKPISTEYSIEELPTLIKQYLRPLCGIKTIFTLEGPLGAGKTTLVRAFLKQLGVKEVITSPTFTYVNSYAIDDITIYHFDLYRIESVEEFIEMGFDEYLSDEDTLSFIEWPDVIEPLLKKKEYTNKVAKIVLKYPEKRFEKRLFELYSE